VTEIKLISSVLINLSSLQAILGTETLEVKLSMWRLAHLEFTFSPWTSLT
jgi:hypothetical protein